MITEQTLFDLEKNIRIEQFIDTETNLLEGESKRYVNDQLEVVLNYSKGLLHGECKRVNLNSVEYVTYENGVKIKSATYNKTSDNNRDIKNLESEMFFSGSRLTKLLKYKNSIISSVSTFSIKPDEYSIKFYENSKIIKTVNIVDGKKYVVNFNEDGIFEKYISDKKNIIFKYNKKNHQIMSNELMYSEYVTIDENSCIVNVKKESNTFSFNDYISKNTFKNGFFNHSITYNDKKIDVNVILSLNFSIDAIKFNYNDCNIVVVYKEGIFPIEMVITKNNKTFTYHLGKINWFTTLKMLISNIPIFMIKKIIKEVKPLKIMSDVDTDIYGIERRKELIETVLMVDQNFILNE